MQHPFKQQYLLILILLKHLQYIYIGKLDTQKPKPKHRDIITVESIDWEEANKCIVFNNAYRRKIPIVTWYYGFPTKRYLTQRLDMG